jgi:hypothetical protein
MKEMNYYKVFLLLALASSILVGCSKDDTPDPQEFQQLSFDGEEVLAMVPEGLKNADDIYAQNCVSYINSAVDMSSFISTMEVPPDAKRSSKKAAGGDTWQWTWSYGGQSFTMFWTFEEDNSKRQWSQDIQFGGGPRVDYIDAWELKDGSGGEVKYNFNWAYMYAGETDQEYEVLNWAYSWNKSNAGDYSLGWYWESDSEEYNYLTNYDIVIKADGSGSVDYYSEGEIFYQMTWDAEGNGSWSMGMGSDLSGTWTAG